MAVAAENMDVAKAEEARQRAAAFRAASATSALSMSVKCNKELSIGLADKTCRLLRSQVIRLHSAVGTPWEWVELAVGWDEEHVFTPWFECIDDLEKFCKESLRRDRFKKLSQECVRE